MGRSGKKSPVSDGQNLVTILFVLGVTGWGFFAIDRLTDSSLPQKTARIQGRALGHESSWRKSAYDWLTKKLAAEPSQKKIVSERVSSNVASEGIPLLPDPKGLKADAVESLETLTEPVMEQHGETEADVREIPVLLYRLNSKGKPVLSQVRRKLSDSDATLTARLNAVIRGPNSRETNRDFIDSFVRKPKILHAAVKGLCTHINFDSNFGAGVSHQTLKYQIRQLYQNSELWTRKSCLEITVRGKYQSHLGSDGIYFPQRLDARWLAENS